MGEPLTKEEKRIIEACKPHDGDVFGTRIDRVMNVASNNRLHHVYESVLIEDLIRIIEKLSKENGE